MRYTVVYDPIELGLDVVRKISNSEVLVRCPYHADRTPSAEYNLMKGLFYCFGCHTAKTAEQVAYDLEGSLLPLSTTVRSLLEDQTDSLEWLDLLRNPLAYDNHYLLSRGVGNDLVDRFEIRANADGVIFPIYNKWGQVRGVQIRHYTNKPKYMIRGERQPIWPLGPTTTLPDRGPVFVVEGVFGVLRAYSCGIVSTVALMGSGGVDSAVEVLTGLGGGRPVYAIMDSDYAGFFAAGKFVLNGIPAVIDNPRSPDDWNVDEWRRVDSDHARIATRDVMDVIERSDEPWKLEAALKKYWKKVEKNGQ